MRHIESPSSRHRVALVDALRDLQTDENVVGVLLAGSLARGNARPDSDIDLIVVHARGGRAGGRRVYETIEVESISRTAESWTEQFSPAQVGDESWGYAFLDGVILHDPTGIVAELVQEAGKSHDGYRVPGEIVEHFVSLSKHVLPKMREVLRGGDYVEIGWSAAVMTHPVIQTLWAANDLPLPSLDIGCLQRRLDDLAVPADAPQLLREMLQVPPQRALELQVSILEAVVPLLEDHLQPR